CASFTLLSYYSFFFFFTVTPTTDIYTLSLHDALPISARPLSAVAGRTTQYLRLGLGGSSHFAGSGHGANRYGRVGSAHPAITIRDRKSTRLNSSHVAISYAVFCLKKKKKHDYKPTSRK